MPITQEPALPSARFTMTDQKAEFFRENGFLVAENAYSPEEISGLKLDAAQICRGEYGAFRGLREEATVESDARGAI